MSSLQRPRVKSFIERKKEETEILNNKEEQIKQQLTTIKNHRTFSKVLNISLNTLENLISLENSDHLININSIIKFKGIKILCSVASENITNDEIIEKVTMILKNMISNDNKKTYELSKLFLEKNGQNDIFQLLINLKDKKCILNLLEIIFILIPIPQFFKILIDSEMTESIKFLIDYNENNFEIKSFLYKLISKITYHKKGRDLLINKNFCEKIIHNIKISIQNKNSECFLDGLIILDNILKNDKEKIVIKELEIIKILGEGISVFFDNKQIYSMINKIYLKIISTDDVKEKLKKLKSKDIEKININENLNELMDLFNYLSIYIFVGDIAKIILLEENIKLIHNYFDLIYSIDLKNKNENYLMNYISLMKYLLIIFKKMITFDSEFINEKNQKRKLFMNNKLKILNCVKKIFEAINQKEDENNNKEIKSKFNSFFSEYCDIFYKLYKMSLINKNSDNTEEILLLKYIIEKIIMITNKFNNEDEKVNYYFSFLLKIIIENNDLNKLLIKCFHYFQNIINISQNKFTLSNIFDVMHIMIKSGSEEIIFIKPDIISTIIKFMKEKSKYRYPNLINLKILEIFLNSEQDEITNNNKNDFIYSICSVMFIEYQTIYNKELEKKILIEGSKLLKKLISYQFFEEKIQELTEIIREYNSERNKENIEKLKDNIIFLINVLNINEFLTKGEEKIFNIIKDLITKEINYIENYKKEKSKEKEINEEYNEICFNSTVIMNLSLNLLRKIEDWIITNYIQNNDEKFIKKIKKIIELNLEIIENSSDTINLINHLRQLRKNIPFISHKESVLKFKDKTIYDKYIDSLINLLRKNISQEKICFEIIKAFISFSYNNINIYSILVKKDYINIILKILKFTNNSLLGYEIIDLIKSICFSSQKNLIELTNQNIINVLFEINTKFINENKIVNDIDLIVNEVKKLPGQGVHIEHILIEAIKNFNQNMKNNFDNNDIKIKILNDLIIINSYNINKIQIKKLVSNIDFINNFISLLNKTLKEKTFSQIIDKLFTVEIELIKKIIRQLSLNKDKESDKYNQDLCDILLLILFHPSIFSNNFLLACKTFLYYIQNDYLYSKFLSHKIDKSFIEKMLEQKENYSADLQIIKVVNKIISYLALKNSDFAKYIFSIKK